MKENIKITDKAREEFLRLSELQTNGKSAVRIFIESGGCSGLSYGIIFDEKRENDSSFWFDKLEVVVDNISIMYVNGVEIDFSDDLIGGGFKMNNPNAKATCGCGSSFTT